MGWNPLHLLRARVGAKREDAPDTARAWTATEWRRQTKPHGHTKGPLSKRLRRVIVVMDAEGKRPDEIAAAIGCHRATVYRWLQRAKKEAQQA